MSEDESTVLTADLVHARKRKGQLHLVKLRDDRRVRAQELASQFLDAAQLHVGRSRDEFDAACDAVAVRVEDRRLADGLRKLIEDRCAFETQDDHDPVDLRNALFSTAREFRRRLANGDRFNREVVLDAVARDRGLTVEALEAALYSDLRGAQVLLNVDSITPEGLIATYDQAQAQAILLRAVRVVADVTCLRPQDYRVLFHRLKFLRLIHTIEPNATGGYRLTIDGPYSLFDSVTKYGLQLALLLPTLQICHAWKLEAELRWGKQKECLRFELEGEGETSGSSGNAEHRLTEPTAALLRGLQSLDSPWRVAIADSILDLKGIGCCVPDLVFEHVTQKTRVYVEVMGYWSRDAVWRRVELVKQGLAHRIIFAVSKKLRVSEEVLGDNQPGALYVYAGTMSPRAILERVAHIGGE